MVGPLGPDIFCLGQISRNGQWATPKIEKDTSPVLGIMEKSSGPCPMAQMAQGDFNVEDRDPQGLTMYGDSPDQKNIRFKKEIFFFTYIYEHNNILHQKMTTEDSFFSSIPCIKISSDQVFNLPDLFERIEIFAEELTKEGKRWRK